MKNALPLLGLLLLISGWAWFNRIVPPATKPYQHPPQPIPLAELALALRTGQPFLVYSIQPREPGPGDERHQVLGQVPLRGAPQVELAEAILDGIKSSDGLEAGCFNPRHAVRAGDLSLLICYECCQIYVEEIPAGGTYSPLSSGRRSSKYLTTSSPEANVNRLLNAHKIPLSKL